MKNFVFVVFAMFCVFSVGCKDDEAEDCVGGCGEGKVCVGADCKTQCAFNEDCFDAGLGAGWICRVKTEGESGYCSVPVDGEEGVLGEKPTAPVCVASVEICDGLDNDCDEEVDEGVKNACGTCGAMPTEICDGIDNDCDGQVDEGVKNACGKCGANPVEICNGLDDDCDAEIPDVENDSDADGFRVCEGDCNDKSAEIAPDMAELCNGVDDNCNGKVLEGEWDEDADGVMVCEGDCDDADKSIFPKAVELCNAVDDDCDADTDEDFFVGVPCLAKGACGEGKYECDAEFAYRCSSGPGGSEDKSIAELCSDNVDNDCDGSVDEGCACDEDDLMICGESDVGECKFALQVCLPDGTWDDCEDAVGPVPEMCDGVDGDCDGILPLNEFDADSDGYMVCEADCNDADATVKPDAVELCNAVDDDCDGEADEDFFVAKPCNGVGACGVGVYECDGDSSYRCSTMPGASVDMSSVEVCSDNIDNNCDGSVDEGCSCEYNAEQVVFIVCGETDIGECEFGTQECQPDGVFGVCVGSIGPQAEMCNGMDDDCDGVVAADEADADDDGYMVCEADCNDADATVKPDAVELCNAVDDDCDGSVDEDFFVGVPCNGVGACGLGKYECDGDSSYRCSTMPAGSADQSVVEACSDNKDNDCDGSVDEGCACDLGDLKLCGTNSIGVCKLGLQMCGVDGLWSDCVGEIEPSAETCNAEDDDCDGMLGVGEVDADMDGFMVCESDCNDADAAVNPEAKEFCNGVDDDCDGQVDDGYFIGAPCDGEGVCGAGHLECNGEQATVCSTSPGGSKDESLPEVCDKKDNDCDGELDEGCECDPGDELICGTTSVGICQFGWRVCGDDGAWGDCQNSIEPSDEVCNGTDDDCDGQVDDGVLNACGQCGDVPVEVCNGADDDCDGQVDDGVLNACGQCGEVPAEICNSKDDDCDGSVDEDFFVGAPCNGIGLCGAGKLECAGFEQVICSTMPSASQDASKPEVCGDNKDNDCDGSVDEGCECDPGDEKVCGTSKVGECKLGWQKCGDDGLWAKCEGNIEPKAEECNGLDDNCNGAVGPGEVDSDADSFMVCENDCNDDDSAVNTSVDEFCNGADDDCDGVVDEGFFIGIPCVGLGNCGAGVYECAGSFGYQCSTMPGASKDASKPEVCGDNKDNDCDGSVDQGCECDPGDLAVCGSSIVGVCKKETQVCTLDGQWGECQGSVEPSPEQCNGLDDNCNGSLPADEQDADADGFMVCENDCNDDDPLVNPEAVELCNGADDDCDGSVDEGYFLGAPCDGTGDCGFGKLECDGADSTICSTSPGGSEDKSSAEVCGDNKDNDCDAVVDDGCECDPEDLMVCGTTDVGVCQLGLAECQAIGTWGGCVGNIEPSDEQCNGLDDDCNGSVPADEADADKDGYLVCENDCDDINNQVSPNETEVCNNIDDDCDGDVDEGCGYVMCNICCEFGLGHPVVWWGGDPPNAWSGAGYCDVWQGTVQQICLRGPYPVPGYTDAGWVDWNCQNGLSWGGWEATGVLWCVNQSGTPVDFEVVPGAVDAAQPEPEGEIILLDGLCE